MAIPRKFLCFDFFLIAWLFLVPTFLEARPFQVEDLQRLLRAGDAQLSPDGKCVAFTVARSDVATNKMVRNLWLVPAAGGEARPLTFGERGSNERPRWSPDSQWIYFLSSRVDDTPQVFKLPLSGGEAAQVTHSPVAIDSFVLSPDGKLLALTISVFPECGDLQAIKQEEKKRSEGAVKARVLTEVPFRRWDSWVNGKRNHIFFQAVDGGEPKDLTPGDADSPIWTESGSEEVAFAPDSKEFCFSRYTESEGFIGNSDLFVMPVTGGPPTQITTNRATDTTPVYSPDGRYIAYTATLRPELESDQPRLFLYERRTGRHINLSEELDRPVESYVWNPDSRSLWVTLEDQAQGAIVKLDVETKRAIRFATNGSSGDVQISNDGNTLVFSHTDFSHPADMYRLDVSRGQGATPTPITHLNAQALRDIEFGQTRSFTFAGWHGEPVQCWEVKPPGFESAKRYPILLLMHGGPESCWLNQFHYRWNAQLFAAAGYVTILPNFHGSTSFGLRFMDAIKGQWGGAPFEDQMLAVDEALKWQYVDGTRQAAAGASYGGYMANWVEGHTDRFRTIVSHDGLYDLLNALYACDYPGGIEKEFKGAPWTNQKALIEQSPVSFAKNFKTPMLIIHGEKDYRVDPSSGYAMFQLLQAMKIPSKLLFFPDENHWVLKPANSILWYHTVLEWLDQWVKPDQSECDNLRKNWPHR